MANLQFENLHSIQKQLIDTIQTAQTVRISTRNDITEVLSIGVDSFVNSYEAAVGEVSFYGKTALRLVYTDGVGTSGSTYNADFTASISNDAIDVDTKMVFEVTVIDQNVQVDGNTANVNLLLEISAWGYVATDTPVLSAGEDMYVLSSEKQFCCNAEVHLLPTVIAQQLTASHSIQTVLLAQSSVFVQNYLLDNNILTVSGTATVRLTYLSQNELVTDNLSVPFSSELEVDLDSASTLNISAIVRNTKVRLDIAEEQQNTSFTAEISCLIRVEAYQTKQVRIVEDAYLSNGDFDFTKKCVATSLCYCTVAAHSVDQQLELPSSSKPLTIVNINSNVAQTVFNSGSCTVKGVIFATILLMADGGIKGHPVEIPFVCTASDEAFDGAMIACCNVESTDVVLQGNTLAANVRIKICCYNTVEYNVIIAAEELVFDKQGLPAIEVCLAQKGETLWSLAKSLHVSTEELIATNPQITSPLQEDARIIVYNKL